MSGFTMDIYPSVLGKGKPGIQPRNFTDTQADNIRGINRKFLTKSFGNIFNSGLNNSPLLLASKGNSLCGSFRAAYNSGDVRGSVNSSTNKIYGIEANAIGKIFPIHNNLNPGGVRRDGTSSYSGNPRYVHDVKEFIRYKKLKTVNQVYNDSSFGGDDHDAAQHARRRMTI